jgi:hypothetical protein
MGAVTRVSEILESMNVQNEFHFDELKLMIEFLVMELRADRLTLNLLAPTKMGARINP